MRRNGKISDMDTLEKEIYRLKLESKMTEARIDKNLEFLKQNYPVMFFNTVISEKAKQQENAFKRSFFKNESLNTIFSSVADHIAENATAGIREKIDKFLGKK